MASSRFLSGLNRRAVVSSLALLPVLSRMLRSASAQVSATEGDPLSSWNGGPAKQAIIDFVRTTTDQASPNFVPREDRIATFDQDGTLWVEHPVYSQMMFCFDRVRTPAPSLRDEEPFKTVLSGSDETIAKLTMPDLERIIITTLSGMTTGEFDNEVKTWLTTAKDHRWKRPYTELTYKPMSEVMSYLRANGFKTFIVTGFGQDFVRVYSQQVYDIPREQVVGSALAVKYAYAADRKPILIKEPKLMLNDNDAGKPEGIHLMIGRRPRVAFGNSTGDQQMLEYTGGGTARG